MDESYLSEARAELELVYLETDLNGVITQVNDALLQLTGFTPGELLGADWKILHHPEVPQWVFESMHRELASGHPWQGTIKIQCKKNTECWMHVTASTFNHAGQAAGNLLFFKAASGLEISQAKARYPDQPSVPPFSLARWFARLSLQAKLQLMVQPILLIGGMLATLGVYSQMKDAMMVDAQHRAEATAMQVIDSANMLMITGEVSRPENRRLMIKKIVEGQNLQSLRLLRTEQVVRQFGEGLPEERLDDALVAKTIANSVAAGVSIPYFALEHVDGKPVFRAITPYIESHNFHETDCLSCHNVAVGSSNGASDIRIDLSNDFAGLHHAILLLIGGQILLQGFLFFFIGWVGRKFVSKPVETIKEHLSEIVNGNYSGTLDISGRDEVGELLCSLQTTKLLLGSAVNRNAEKMLETLLKKDLLERQSRVLENIILSHEKVSQWKEFVQEILGSFHSFFSYNIFYIAFAEEHGLSLFIYYMNSYSDEDKRMARTVLTMGMLSKLNLPLDAALDIEEFQVHETETIMPIGEIKMLTVAVPGEHKVDLAGLLGVAYGSARNLNEQEKSVIRSILAVMVMVVGSSKVLSQTLQELEFYSSHDPLTGLHNRRYFNDMLEYEVGRSARHQHEFSILMLDLDDFKDVNDTYGHPCGDAVLKQIAEALHKHVRIGDLATRLGGDEFAIILSETNKSGAMVAAEKLRTELRNISYTSPTGKSFHVTVSIGLVTYPEDAQNIFDLMSSVDIGLYRAKEMGKDGIGTVDGNKEQIHTGRAIRDHAEQLRQSLKDDKVIPYFQPIFNCHSGELFAFEALARMQGPDGEIVSAGAFVETLEKYGMGRELDRPMVEKSMMALKGRMVAPGTPNARLFINLSAQEIQGRGILGFAEQLCNKLELPPSSIVFEILERDAIGDMTHMRKFLADLGKKGFAFALDDFGSGYNSFHYLREMHFDFVKIDGSYVRNILNSKIDYALVRNLSHLCRDIGTQTVAEFVESEEILLALRDMGINYVQGFHLGLPLPKMDINGKN